MDQNIMENDYVNEQNNKIILLINMGPENSGLI